MTELSISPAPATGELSSPDHEVGPLDISRSDLRAMIEDYNSRNSFTLDRTSLASLEKAVLTNTDKGGRLEDHFRGLEGMPAEDHDKIVRYISELDNARDDESKRDDVSNYLAEDLERRRDELAEQARNDINKTFGGHKKEYTEAQSAYDESFRTFSRWSMVDLEGKRAEELHAYGTTDTATEKAYKDERLALATNLYLEELERLREATRGVDADESDEEKNWVRKAADFEISYGRGEKKFGKNRGEKRKISLGKVGLFLTTGGAAGIARGVVGVSAMTGFIPIIAAGGVIGGAVGAARSAYVAHRDTKGVLAEASDSEEEKARELLTATNESTEIAIDKALNSHFTSEVDKARKGRRRKIGGAALRGMGIGIGTGVAGSAAGWVVGALPDLIDKIPDSLKFWERLKGSNGMNKPGGGLGGELGAEGGVDPTEDPSAEPENVESGSAGDTSDGTSHDAEGQDPSAEESDDVPDEEVAVAPTETSALDDLLTQYSENPVTIESGEGPYETMEKLGITDPEMKEAIYDNPEVKEELMKQGLIYDVGDGSDDWGWKVTGELSADNVRSIFENANLESVSSPEINIPASYDADLHAIAEAHPVVTDITPGMGGYELMEELELPAKAWDDIEDKLTTSADYYNMGAEHGNHTGIGHTGALTPEGFRELVDELDKAGYTLAA